MWRPLTATPLPECLVQTLVEALKYYAGCTARKSTEKQQQQQHEVVKQVPCVCVCVCDCEACSAARQFRQMFIFRARQLGEKGNKGGWAYSPSAVKP